MASSPRKAKKQPVPSTAILGANVYRRRVLRVPKLSQQGLATMSGVSVETIRLLEQNRDVTKPQLSPQFDTLDRVAAALGCEVHELLEQSPTPSKPTGRPRHLRSVPDTGDARPR